MGASRLAETMLWFELLTESGIVSAKRLLPLHDEPEELLRIVNCFHQDNAKARLTARTARVCVLGAPAALRPDGTSLRSAFRFPLSAFENVTVTAA